ncbi:NupC/NupG family nucleoside CNT transporter [Paenibacillus xerothermodurans]|uniref:NupC/NupG family nucleoside CNT transporter n=1 Tax=Paenibacillus xerothermodurans TaxID=1977292 RepID=A0A2W1NBY0_PAEXE|nr:nucleoside transporter C-terminal domain-containing protein [Paenibacillus xerothermodurans]PZE22179.1 NupC/NupG family nucleoside CNT transporter [Paenibacillus xerothermodurans]
MSSLIGFVGILFVLGLCFALSIDRKNIKYKSIGIMLVLQFGLAWFMLNTAVGQDIINTISAGFNELIRFAGVGVTFVFGGITDAPFVFFLNVLLVIVFFSTLLSILTYIKVLPVVIRFFGGLLSRITGMPKVESFNAVNSMFFGQSEALLAIKSQFRQLSKERLFIVCASAMGSVSASISGSYMELVPARFVLVAMVLNAFSALIISSLLMPVRVPKEEDVITVNEVEQPRSIFEAMGDGALDGLKIAAIVAGMLIAFIATMELVNAIIQYITGLFGFRTNLQEILGYILAPFVYLSGVPAEEVIQAGGIMGTKIVINEFVAMLQFQPLIPIFSDRTVAIVSTYLISFANFSSIGIIAGSVKAIDDEKAKVVAGFGLKMLFAATLASLLSAMIVGIFIG